MTILDALTWGTEKIRSTLHEKKTSGHIPGHDAQILLAHVLGVRRSFLFAHGNDTLNETHWDTYRTFIERRTNHEPISHVLGSAEFYGRIFMVNRHVLTPRPETEELVELALKESETQTYVDVGTGSGAIAITLALESKKPVYATDIDPFAIGIAQHNAQQLNVNVHFFEGNLLNPLPDTIRNTPNITYVANLPYIPTGARTDIDPDVLKYEPHGALFSGIDGLELSMKLLKQIPKKMPFVLLLELDTSNIHFCADLATNLFPEGDIEIKKDLSNRYRFLRLENHSSI